MTSKQTSLKRCIDPINLRIMTCILEAPSIIIFQSDNDVGGTHEHSQMDEL